MILQDCERLKEYIEYGYNPYLAIADICEALYGTASKAELRIVFNPLDFLDTLERESVSELLNGKPESSNAAFLKGRGFTAKSQVEILDWARGFLKDCSDYLSSMRRLDQFRNDPLQKCLYCTSHAVTKLDELRESKPNQLVGLEQPENPEQYRDLLLKEVQELIGRKDSFTINDFSKNGDKVYVVSERLYEIWMELMTTCNVCLALLGRSHNDGWSRTMELAQTKTQGYPGGVCSYKATGDVYRKLTRSIRERDSRLVIDYETAPGPVQKRNLIADSPENKYVIGVVQVFGISILCEIDGTDYDLTPKEFRLAGATYCYLQYIGALSAVKEFNEKFGKQLHAGDDDVPDDGKVSKNLPICFVWLHLEKAVDEGPFCKYSDLKEVFKDQVIVIEKTGQPDEPGPCALGIDEGVYSPIFSSRGQVPYTMREVSEDFHESFRNQLLDVFFPTPDTTTCSNHTQNSKVNVGFRPSGKWTDFSRIETSAGSKQD